MTDSQTPQPQEQRIAPPLASDLEASSEEKSTTETINQHRQRLTAVVACVVVAAAVVLGVCGICFGGKGAQDDASSHKLTAPTETASDSDTQSKSQDADKQAQGSMSEPKTGDDSYDTAQDDTETDKPSDTVPGGITDGGSEDTLGQDETSQNASTQNTVTEDDLPGGAPDASGEQNDASHKASSEDSGSSYEENADNKPASQQTASAPAPEPETPVSKLEQPATITVHVAIDSSRAVPFGYPSSLGGGTVELREGASVYDALCATGVAVGGSSSYVSSIGGLSEFACGSGSGWLYFVNGVSPSVGCNSAYVQNGDTVTWIYTIDLGGDL